MHYDISADYQMIMIRDEHGVKRSGGWFVP